jgi:type 1 glutamine amidotransferase
MDSLIGGFYQITTDRATNYRDQTIKSSSVSVMEEFFCRMHHSVGDYMLPYSKNVACLLGFALCCFSGVVLKGQTPAPKRLLVIATSTRNHFPASIDVAEKALTRIAAETHAFTLDFVQQPDVPQPKKPKPPAALPPNASAADQAVYAKAQTAYQADSATYDVAEAKYESAMKQALQKLSPESLKNYDGVVFCYTAGDLPMPDFDGFLAWVKAGHAFIGFGNAMETMVSFPAYYDMLGGKWVHFKGTQGWKDIELVNQDTKHPANKGMPARWTIKEFSYKIPNFTLSDPAHTHELLAVEKSPTDGTPGHFPVAWCRDYGEGRVFYTALGGNFDLWDPAYPHRKNPPETAQLFEAHLIGGLFWALRIDPEKKS